MKKINNFKSFNLKNIKKNTIKKAGKNLFVFSLILSLFIVFINFFNINDMVFGSEIKNHINDIKNEYDLIKKEYQEKNKLEFYAEIIGNKELAKMIIKYSEENQLDTSLFIALIKIESSFNNYAVNLNTNGSIDRGLCQLNSNTFFNFKSNDFFNPEINIENGAKYLKWCLKKSDNNTVKALAYYNAGFGAVSKKDVGEHTLNYIDRVLNEKMMIDIKYNKKFNLR